MTLLAFIAGFSVGAGLMAIATWMYVRIGTGGKGSRL